MGFQQFYGGLNSQKGSIKVINQEKQHLVSSDTKDTRGTYDYILDNHGSGEVSIEAAYNSQYVNGK